MLRYLDKARRYLWTCIEVAFLLVLLSVLIHLVLGPSSGGFVKGVYDNLVAFGNAVPGATLIGVGALMLLVWYIQQRMAVENERKK
jgi:ABC-type Fe3+ transport system permease subunit